MAATNSNIDANPNANPIPNPNPNANANITEIIEDEVFTIDATPPAEVPKPIKTTTVNYAPATAFPEKEKKAKEYGTPLSQHESDAQKKKSYSIRATKRVLAPFVKARHKPKTKVPDNKYFSFYVQKKPSILMRDMTNLLYDGVDFISVLNETADVLKEATNSTDIVVYMVDESTDEIYQVSRSYTNDAHRIAFKIATNTTVAAHVAFTKEFVKIDDLIEDMRFPQGLGNSEVTVKAVLSVPVLTPENDCLAVFDMYRDLDMIPYEDRDLRLVIVMCGWIGSTIYQNTQRITLQKQQELNEYLLDLTKCYFADTMLLDKLITEVVNFAKTALNAEHGLFFVMKPAFDELYADFYEEGIGADRDILFKKNVKIKLGQDTDLIGVVANKGITINVRNAFKDNRVFQDKKKGYIVRSVLCMPIRGIDEVLGVMQIINKRKGACFTKSDEVLFNTFSVYCSFVLSYARLYDKMTKMSNLNEVYKDLLAHHMQPCMHDLTYVNFPQEITNIPPKFNQFDFYITDFYEPYMPQLVVYMITEISKDLFKSLSDCTKFVLVIQKSYHDNPYHNFHHAFNVCHSIFNMVKRNSELFTELEMRAFILAAYCHDVDHYGFTNNFLEITSSYLSQLYEESIFENHHAHVATLVIEQLKVFDHMPKEEYKKFIKEIRKLILATDLATYFKRRGKLYVICSENHFSFADDLHRDLLKSVMMTMADLSGLCKPFNIAKVLTDNLYMEFYKEGDREKEMGLCPLSIMDREKQNMIPADQVQFLTVVLLPCALIITKILPNCGQLYKEALRLRETWEEIYMSQGQKLWSAEDSIPDKRFR